MENKNEMKSSKTEKLKARTGICTHILNRVEYKVALPNLQAQTLKFEFIPYKKYQNKRREVAVIIC